MTSKERAFIKKVWDFHAAFGRGSLPWRKTKDPYRILVSEIMLQQTQVERVVSKYTEFLKLFPTVQALSEASLGDVLRAWQGLGYNRRAKMLHECARIVVREYRGIFPKDSLTLRSLPGIGPYTAGAIMAFAYNTSEVIIETNIRTVYLHVFFKDREGVSDAELLPLIERTLDLENPKGWYSALMDYGTHIKKTEGNSSRRSKHHVRQKPFKDSDRQVRGSILRALTDKPCTLQALVRVSAFSKDRLETQITQLQKEGLVVKEGRLFRLP